MAYPPKPWEAHNTGNSERTVATEAEALTLPSLQLERDFQPEARQNYRLILRDKADQPHSTWLPTLRLDHKEVDSLVPTKPADFAQEISAGTGKIFVDSAGQVVQVNRGKHQRLAFSYTDGKIRTITADRSISVTTDDTNWFYQGDGPPNLPDWRGRVEITKDGTVTVSRPDEKDIFRIDGSHSIERTDNSKIDFNPSDRVTEVVNASGRQISFGYSFSGEMRSMTDPRGTYTTRNGHDWYREQNKAPNPPDWKGTVNYSHNGSVSERSESGNSMLWNFDSTKVTHFRNGRHLEIDKADHVTKLIDANNQITTFKYDQLGNMTEMTDTRGAYSTKNGANWFKSTNIDQSKPDWRGTVTVSASSGLVTEKNSDTKAVDRWTLDGRHLKCEPLLAVRDFNGRAQAIFGVIDKNHNGYLSGTELGQALEDPSFTGQDAQVIAALYKNRDALKKLNDDEMFSESEVTRKDLTEFDKFAQLKDNNALVQRVEWFLERTNKSQIDTLPCTLYRDETDPRASITYKAIAQGTIGDCYLEAVIASIAASSPAKIRNMIEDHGNGSYTVTFPGDRAHPITVKAPTEAEMGLNTEPSEYGIWPNVLEKAFGEYFVENSILPTKGYSSTEGADGGGLASQSTKLLTGKSVDEYWCSGWRSSSTNQNIKKELTEAFAQGRAVTCSIGSIEHGQTKDGYTKRHVYSIIGWDPSGKEGGTLTIRNPWGNKTVGPGGMSTMSYQQYLNNFNVITIEGR
ncbi:hypothetical protein BH10CYA1_BH10CYA1_28280 [soil metagenome]